MKIIIERDENGLSLDLASGDWDHYEVIGMLEQAKHIVQREVDRLCEAKVTKETK